MKVGISNSFYLTSFLCGTERIPRDVRMTHLVLSTLLSQVSYCYLAGHYVISDQAKFRILRIDYFGQVRVGLLFCDSLRESLNLSRFSLNMHRFRVACFHLRGKERGLRVFSDGFFSYQSISNQVHYVLTVCDFQSKCNR